MPPEYLLWLISQTSTQHTISSSLSPSKEQLSTSCDSSSKTGPTRNASRFWNAYEKPLVHRPDSSSSKLAFPSRAPTLRNTPEMSNEGVHHTRSFRTLGKVEVWILLTWICRFATCKSHDELLDNRICCTDAESPQRARAEYQTVRWTRGSYRLEVGFGEEWRIIHFHILCCLEPAGCLIRLKMKFRQRPVAKKTQETKV